MSPGRWWSANVRMTGCQIIHSASPIITSHIVNMQKYGLTRQMDRNLGCILFRKISRQTEIDWKVHNNEVCPGLVPGWCQVNNLWSVVTNVAKYNWDHHFSKHTRCLSWARSWPNHKNICNHLKIFRCRSPCGSCCRRTWAGSAAWRGPWSPAGPSSPGWRWTTGETGQTNFMF